MLQYVYDMFVICLLLYSHCLETEFASVKEIARRLAALSQAVMGESAVSSCCQYTAHSVYHIVQHGSQPRVLV